MRFVLSIAGNSYTQFCGFHTLVYMDYVAYNLCSVWDGLHLVVGIYIRIVCCSLIVSPMYLIHSHPKPKKLRNYSPETNRKSRDETRRYTDRPTTTVDGEHATRRDENGTKRNANLLRRCAPKKPHTCLRMTTMICWSAHGTAR